MNSNRSIDEQLINAVKENDVLYNKFSKSYKNIAVKWEVWRKIGTSLGISDHECTTRWKSLRDKSVREKKAKDNKPSGSACISKPEWCHYEEMSFLSDFVKPRKTTGNYEEVVGEEVEVLHDSDVFDVGDISTSTDEIDVLDDNLDTSNSSTFPAPKKRKDNSLNSIEQHLMGTMTAIKSFIEKKAQDSNESGNSNILKRVDVLLGGLRSTNREIARKKIIEYLCKCQILDLNDGSVIKLWAGKLNKY